MNSVHLGSVPVGAGAPCVLVAETGTFFNQDVEKAKDYLRAVAAAGAPVFKTEILHDAEVCLRGTQLNCRFSHASGVMLEDYRKLIERKVVPLTQYGELFALARELGVPFVASVYDFTGIDFLVREGGAGIKIARHNIDHLPLIRHAARTGLPLIFDAGEVYVREIARALETARAEGAEQIIVNHHPGSSPAPAVAHHLQVIGTYKRLFDVPVGLSCHYRGDEILYTAIGCGCDLIEKGVVDDPDAEEQEVVSAIRISELPGLLERIYACSAALGHAKPPSVKEPRDLSVRKGLVAARTILAGEPLTLKNVAFAWPPLGISVGEWDVVVNQSAAHDLHRGEPIGWGDVRFFSNDGR